LRRITDFSEIKAYVDIFNERGHPGVKEPVNPFLWWNHKWSGKIDDYVHAFFDDGLVVVLELENKTDVANMLLFALCPQKNILRKVLDITKNYDKVMYNSDCRDRYRSITRRLDGLQSFQGGKFCYTANGRNAWNRYALL
jgi:hypothetical protein